MRLRFTVLVALLLVVPVCLFAGKKPKPPEHFCAVSFVVVKDSNGKPLKNASVVVHGLKRDGSQESEGFQLKTDNDGRAHIEDIPYGKFRLQVIAHSMQTYGDDIELNQPQQEFVIRLKPPAGQVSIYD
jgi:hypothetical protein